MQRIFTTIGTFVMVLFATSVIASTAIVHAQGSDFAVSSTPFNQCISLGGTASYKLTVSSVGGFAGSVSLDDSVDPSASNGPALSSIPSTVDLASDQIVSFDLVATTTQSTAAQVYDITVYGLSGATVHSTTVALSFQPTCGGPAGATAMQPNGLSLLTPLAGITVTIVAIAAAISGVAYAKRAKPFAGP